MNGNMKWEMSGIPCSIVPSSPSYLYLRNGTVFNVASLYAGQTKYIYVQIVFSFGEWREWERGGEKRKNQMYVWTVFVNTNRWREKPFEWNKEMKTRGAHTKP